MLVIEGRIQLASMGCVASNNGALEQPLTDNASQSLQQARKMQRGRIEAAYKVPRSGIVGSGSAGCVFYPPLEFVVRRGEVNPVPAIHQNCATIGKVFLVDERAYHELHQTLWVLRMQPSLGKSIVAPIAVGEVSISQGFLEHWDGKLREKLLEKSLCVQLVYPYRGVNLETAIKACDDFGVLMRALTPVLHALCWLAALKIVHGDVQPRNIVYDGVTCRLIDFENCRGARGCHIHSSPEYHYWPPDYCENSDCVHFINGPNFSYIDVAVALDKEPLPDRFDIYGFGATVATLWNNFTGSVALPDKTAQQLTTLLRGMLQRNSILRLRTRVAYDTWTRIWTPTTKVRKPQPCC